MPCELDSRQKVGAGHAKSQRCKLALATWNVTLLAGKEPELVCEVEQYQLHILWLTSTHSVCSGTSLDSLILRSCLWRKASGRCGDTRKPPAKHHHVEVLPSE